jgi:putative endonuclease
MNVEKIYKSGRPGELAAVSYLVHQGWSIREVNWRFRRAEIDIIAEFRQTIIFVEVKSRTCPKSPPELAVSAQQESRLADAAREYLWINQWTGPFRFDVIAISIHPQQEAKITHFEDAFFPGHH